MLTRDRVRDALDTVSCAFADTANRRAGVAIVLAGEPDCMSVCFMQRVTRRGDRWSGDIALPGGWAKPHEMGFLQTAMRETYEEVGIQLNDAEHLGDIAPINISRNNANGGLIGACVFYVGRTRPHLTLDPLEVADAFWVTTSHFYDPSNHTVVHWSRSGAAQPRPAVRVDERVIWGLTYRIWVRFSRHVLGDDCPLDFDPH